MKKNFMHIPNELYVSGAAMVHVGLKISTINVFTHTRYALARRRVFLLVEHDVGLEPATYALQMRCSTN